MALFKGKIIKDLFTISKVTSTIYTDGNFFFSLKKVAKGYMITKLWKP